jgi:hypothetical protein
MADALTTISEFIVKPSSRFAAGVVLFGAVWGFFKGVESVLSNDTKLEIAIWLIGQKLLGPKVEPWPETFARVFDRVFGEKHLSWQCFSRSALASLAALGVSILTSVITSRRETLLLVVELAVFWGYAIFMNILSDYVSLLKTRVILGKINNRRFIHTLAWLCFDILITGGIVILTLCVLFVISAPSFHQARLDEVITVPLAALMFLSDPLARAYRVLWVVPAFFTSIWLWLYAGSGFLLKAVRRFDIGFQWFNRKFDIEEKPLSAIGLVAGALVALTYWGVVGGSWLVQHFRH